MAVTPSPETALVGALITSPAKIIDVVDIVKYQDFADKNAALAYTTILNLWQSKKTVDLTTVAANAINIVEYLASCTSGAFGPGAVDYANEVAKAGKTRRIREATRKIASGSSPDQMLSDLLGLYQQEMSAGKKPHDIKSVIQRAEKLVAKNKANGRLGIDTGFETLRDKWISYVPGHIWGIGGWTSTGKTAVMTQQIVNILTTDSEAKLLVISTEMTEEQLVSRLIANLTGIPTGRLDMARFESQEEEERVEAAKESLSLSRLTVYDDIYSVSEIETAFRLAELTGGVDIGWIDYIQNCTNPEAANGYQEQSTMAKRFQRLAKDTRSCIICLSQVSNEVGRGNTDLLEFKGAGEWGAVVDRGIMLQRHKTEKHRLKFDVKKNRHGALTEMGLEFKAVYTSLKEVPLG